MTTSTPSVPLAEPAELAGLSLGGRVRRRLTSSTDAATKRRSSGRKIYTFRELEV